MRVSVSDQPIRQGQEWFCVAVFLSGNPSSQERAARRLRNQIGSPPFSVPGLQIAHNRLLAPWGARHSFQSALRSLINPESIAENTTDMARVVDRNTLASVLSAPCGAIYHLFGPRQRKWRFARFTLIEDIGLLGLTWTVIGDPINNGVADRPTVVLRCRWNTQASRLNLSNKLRLATGLTL
jgi:hypothetical protein